MKLIKRWIFILAITLTSFSLNPYKLQYHPHDLACMTANIFFEARGEGQKGMEVVAQVTMNRVKHKKYPVGVCPVVFQPKQFSWTWQQPWNTSWKVLNGDLSGFKAQDIAAYQLAKKTAVKALEGRVGILPESALWYHTTQVKPIWRKKLQKVATVGKHIVYKEK